MFKINIKQLFLVVILGFITVSCDDDNPASSDEHIDAEGFALEINDVEVYRELEGTITGDLSVVLNETLEVSVHFLDHDGEEIVHEDEEGEEDELSFSITDSYIISVVAEEHEDDGDTHDHGEEHHELGFELTGLSAGTTTFTLSLMHEDHADYTSLPITVTVTE